MTTIQMRSTNSMLWLALLLVLLQLSYFGVNALPTGAVSCEGGKAAVNGLHLQQTTVLTGPLAQDNIEFQINGVALQPGVPFEIELGVDYKWKLITAGTFFRGFLIRLGNGDDQVDTRQSLGTESNTAKVAETACVDAFMVGGVTHSSNVLKNLEEGVLRVHLPSQNMPLDVTVVIQNRNSYSIYYYSGFTINANPPANNDNKDTTGNGDTKPTFTPFSPPAPGPTFSFSGPTTPAPATPAPVTPAPVTPAPVTSAPTTLAPVTANPTANPTAAPITAKPTEVPTSAPVTAKPTDAPTSAPVTAEPSREPTLAPVTDKPTASPATVYLFLRYPTCTTDTPCTMCQGDCDANDECEGALECFHRPQDDSSPVPGCVGAGVAGRDYCYLPQSNSLRPRLPECTVDNPCGECEGDCDDDSECASGLECFLRETGELTPVFGCSGLGIAGLDYCYNASAVNFAVDDTLASMMTATDPDEVNFAADDSLASMVTASDPDGGGERRQLRH